MTLASSFSTPPVHAYSNTTATRNHHHNHLQIKRNPHKTLHFLFISTSSSSTLFSFSSSFPLTPSNPIQSHHNHHHLLLDSTNDNFFVDDLNSAVEDDSRPKNMIFIQEPAWISSLFMKGWLAQTDRELREIEKAKFDSLRRRQIEAETEAWERMVEEYRELEREMRQKKLAPNLPHVKALLLGWFEPLKEAVEAEQKVHRARSKKQQASIAPQVDSLPAAKMAVIVMHKMMGLVMENETGCVQLVQAAVQIGMAVEQEVFIFIF